MTYYKRSDWHARIVPRGEALVAREVRGIALHWPGDASRRDDPGEVMAALRAWQSAHIDGEGWRDIAYQEAIDQDGNVYRLRGLRYRSAANGDEVVNAHYGAVLLVLGIGETPSPAMVGATRSRVRRHRELFPASEVVVPHSAIRPDPTACPGDKVRALIAAGEFEPRRGGK